MENCYRCRSCSKYHCDCSRRYCFGVHTSYGALIGGSIAAIAVGLILELFFFTVDYARSENLQYEDDEYYYYVKAVPKISVSTPEKTVKRINERQETEIIDAEEVRKKARKRRDMKDVDKMLLTQSMEKDFGMKNRGRIL